MQNHDLDERGNLICRCTGKWSRIILFDLEACGSAYVDEVRTSHSKGD